MVFLVENLFGVMMAVALCLPRMLIAMHFIPMFGLQQMPMSIKVGMVIAITTPVSFALMVQLNFSQPDVIRLVMLMMKEAVVGMFLGIFLATPFWIFQSMGALIDNQRGALSAGYLDPTSGPDASMLGDMLSRTLLIYFIQVGVFMSMFTMLFNTYRVWPPLLGFPEIPADGYEVLIERFGYLVESFVLYAGPIVLILLLVESAFAVLGAYSPQMQVYFMAMPAKAIVALIVFVIYFDQILVLMENEGSLLLDLPNILTNVLKEVAK